MMTPKDFPSFQSLKANGWPDFIAHLRQRAFDAFQSLSFPTVHDEDWRFTNVAPFLKIPFKNVIDVTSAQPRSELARGFTEPDQESDQIVFVDGRVSKELTTAPQEIFIGTLGSDLNHVRTDMYDRYLGKVVSPENDVFVAWNTAFFQDVAFIHVPDRFIATKPVQISFINTGVENAVTFPRVLVVLGEGSQLNLMETYSSLSSTRYFTNAVSEIVLLAGAVLQHVKVQQDGSTKLAHCRVSRTAGRDSAYTSLTLTLGSEFSRENLKVTMDGLGGDCTLNGLYLIGENQHSDHHTTVDHAKPHGTSRELYKGILSGKSRAVFNGKVIVRKDAQKTDAEQMNKNLLLSQSARINTAPQLEILADDVKCRHGATIGHLDENALFYLRSRGISDQEARTFLMKGFLQDVTGRIPEGKIRAMLDELVNSRLSQFTGVNPDYEP